MGIPSAESARDINNYVDSQFLLLTQHFFYGGDEGDSCHKTNNDLNAQIILNGDLTEEQENKMLLFIQDGNIVRHPRSDKWVSDWDRTSGDQAAALFCLLFLYKKGRGVHRKILGRHLGRCLFFSNTRRNGTTKKNHGRVYGERNGQPLRYNYNWKVPDFTRLTLFPVIFRTLGWWSFPLNCISDLALVLNVLKRNWSDDTDVLNHLSITYGCALKYPTPFSLLALALMDREHIEWRLWHYCKMDPQSPEFGKEPFVLWARWVEVLKWKHRKHVYPKCKLKGSLANIAIEFGGFIMPWWLKKSGWRLRNIAKEVQSQDKLPKL